MDRSNPPSGIKEAAAQPADISEGLGSFWLEAEAHPRRVAIINPPGDSVTYGALHEANRVSNGLVAMGLRPGDGIAAALPNDHLILEVYLAALQIGLYFTPINYHLTSDEMAYVVRDSEARVLFTDATIVAASEAAKAAGLSDEQCLARGGLGGFRDLDIWMSAQSRLASRHRLAGQRMLYTSGTSGRPKGVRADFRRLAPMRQRPPQPTPIAVSTGGGRQVRFISFPAPCTTPHPWPTPSTHSIWAKPSPSWDGTTPKRCWR